MPDPEPLKPSAATEQIEELFHAALDLKEQAEREAFLEHACAGHAWLRAAVEEMLATQAEVDRFFHEGTSALSRAGEISRAVAESEGLLENAPVVAEGEDEVGKSIGPYQLIERIGEGGCGTVYLAGQELPVRRKVALKIIKLGMDTRRVIAQFEVERQALAMMDHPNIARVLDAGATQTGRPYFVMELVQGVKITDYCDQRNLDIPQRLGLFIQVCGAIQHAHQKGIIHRDIKPSNVLVLTVDGVAVPKVIDFGIAKATDGQFLAEKTSATSREHFIGTPVYMSPEQAESTGLDVDTRSDVYSLGVLLYELLAGKTPFDQKDLLQSGLEEMRRTLREREPQPPSSKIKSLPVDALTQAAQRRGVEPRRLVSLINGDLDWIVMKALEKDRGRRYSTAIGLAADVQRYLAHEPVAARPPSRSYRFRKLVRRNRAAFAAIAAVSVALIAGFTTSSWLFFREREARREAEHARSAEKTLRTASEARADIARAAYLLSRNRVAEADALVEKIPIRIDEPSLEAADVFRKLADWNLRQARWKKGARRLLDLVHANQMDKTDMTDQATRDLIRAGPALVFAGDFANYRQLVQEIIAHFARTQNPVAAEHVLKFSLIVPTDAGTLRSLEPVAKIAKASVETDRLNAGNDNMLAWRAFSVALYDYRRGSFEDAVAMARKCLQYTDRRPTRVAMTHLVMAMALQRLQQMEEASSELRKGAEMVKSKIPENEPMFSAIAGSDESGLWNDWIMAHLLLQEATVKPSAP